MGEWCQMRSGRSKDPVKCDNRSEVFALVNEMDDFRGFLSSNQQGKLGGYY